MTDVMQAKPFREAAQLLATLAQAGCRLRIEGDRLLVYGPRRVLTGELCEAIHRHKMAIFALLLRHTLVRLLRVLDMAQPDIPVGVQEDFAEAWLAAVQLVGDPWAEDDEPDVRLA